MEFTKLSDAELYQLLISCPVYSVDVNRVIRIGSATYIGNGMFVTATHMLEDIVIDTQIDIHGNENTNILKGFRNIIVMHYTKYGVIVWKALIFTTLSGKDSDTVLLVCEGADPVSKNLIIKADILGLKPVIDFHLPSIGAEVELRGYAKVVDGNEEIYPTHKARRVTVPSIDMTITKGNLKDYHVNGIGRPRMLVYQVSAEALSGMSGGPASFDGKVFGTIISAVNFDRDEREQVTFVAPLYHLLGVKTDIFKGYESFYELCADNIVLTYGLCHIRMKNGQPDMISLEPNADCENCPYLAKGA